MTYIPTRWQFQTAARTLVQEVRGEPMDGRKAVAHTLWNRLDSGRWGADLAAVCLSRSQFSGWGPVNVGSAQEVENFRYSTGLADDAPEVVGMISVLLAARGEPDPTNGATHYLRDGTKLPPGSDWTIGAVFCGKFGTQLFYRGVR